MYKPGDRVIFKGGRLHQLEGHYGWLAGTVVEVDADEIRVLADHRTDPKGSFYNMKTSCAPCDVRHLTVH